MFKYWANVAEFQIVVAVARDERLPVRTSITGANCSNLKTAECDVVFVGRERNGTPRFWCRRHFASATSTNGEQLECCKKSNLTEIDEISRLNLNPDDFQGGFAVWGALPPAYNTSSEPEDFGVHVHARGVPDPKAKKEIDDTYKAIEVAVEKDLFGPRSELISTDVAVAYFVSLAFNLEPKVIHCSHCNRLHLDEGIYAVTPHRKHMCMYCGRDFYDDERAVGNPLIAIKNAFGDNEVHREVARSPERLEITQADFPGGIALWASNPAVFWTQPWPEKSGIHLHGYDGNCQRVEDETFGYLEIDGISFSPQTMRLYMAQRLIPKLWNALVSVDCPKCGQPHFDHGSLAAEPHREHECETCGEAFQAPSRKPTIANPIVKQLGQLGAKVRR